MSSKDVAHARRRENHTELPQLTNDAEIAPARILPREPKHECNDLGIERIGCDHLRPREGPVAANEFTVPAHQRCRRDEEVSPPLARKKSGKRCQHGSIGGGEPRTRHLAAKDRELMTKDRDLEVLLIRRRTDSDEVKELSDEQEGDRTAHTDDGGTIAEPWSEP
jgi:hypothetical protein